MKSNLAIQTFLGLYILIFFVYLFGPLIIMSVTAFNSAEFPAILHGNVLVLDGLMRVRLRMMGNALLDWLLTAHYTKES